MQCILISVVAYILICIVTCGLIYFVTGSNPAVALEIGLLPRASDKPSRESYQIV
jgi:hypothetical protein